MLRILVIGVGVLLAVLPAVANATWPGNPGKLLYSGLDVDDAGSRDGIYAISAAGEGNRRIVRTPASEISLSRDGRRIAFFRNRRELWEAASDGSDARRIARLGTGTGDDPAWSPSGTRLLFTRTVGRLGRETDEVWVIRRDGNGARKLANGHYATWSSRGLVAFTTRRAGKVVTIRSSGRGRRIWVPQGSPGAVAHLDFAPDGRRLVYTQVPSELRQWSVRTLDLRTRRMTSFRAWTKRGFVTDVVWAPGGHRLAYVFQPQGNDTRRLRTSRPSGGAVKTAFRFDPLVGPVSIAWQTR